MTIIIIPQLFYVTGSLRYRYENETESTLYLTHETRASNVLKRSSALKGGRAYKAKIGTNVNVYTPSATRQKQTS